MAVVERMGVVPLYPQGEFFFADDKKRSLVKKPFVFLLQSSNFGVVVQ